ncbi:hypothetical protein C8F01DRAFT_1144120 [Mycena amicta]|nr:hypothetical protein C8F01DRAFT_1144120 [Mycena amicta]
MDPDAYEGTEQESERGTEVDTGSKRLRSLAGRIMIPHPSVYVDANAANPPIPGQRRHFLSLFLFRPTFLPQPTLPFSLSWSGRVQSTYLARPQRHRALGRGLGVCAVHPFDDEGQPRPRNAIRAIRPDVGVHRRSVSRHLTPTMPPSRGRVRERPVSYAGPSTSTFGLTAWGVAIKRWHPNQPTQW